MGHPPGANILSWQHTEVLGGTASYGVGGRGDGPPILFLHGWGLSGRTYRASLKRLLARGFRVWAPALPGFDGSAPYAASDDLGDYAYWLDEFCAIAGVDEPVVLMGHSFGGGVAIQAAHDFPDRVRGLVLINSIGGSAWRPNGSVMRSLAERPLWDWGLHFPGDVLPVRQMRRVVPVVLQSVVPNALRNPRALWKAAGIARYADLTAELDVLKQRRLPIVLLWGTHDEIITRASFDALRESLGDPLVVTVEGKHSWLIADPDQFGEVITNVLPIAFEAQRDEHGPHAHDLASLTRRRRRNSA